MKLISVVVIICLFHLQQQVDLGISVRKFVDQKDMSESCKRRLVPSIFLGKQVMDASSHVMQFSRLDMPYSCSLSIRAEIGYNIIMIIHLFSEDSLREICLQNPNQFIVNELGETFGGYWGHIPDTVMQSSKKNYTKFYTLETTATNQSPSAIPTNTSHKNEGNILPQTIPAADKELDYISMDVPLVNVSGNLQLGGLHRHPYDSEEIFDFIYDVTPRNGNVYDTSIMPIAQFSLRDPKYGKDLINDAFTEDTRLTYSTKRRITIKKSKWYANRKYNYKKVKLSSKKKNVTAHLRLFTYPNFTSKFRRTTISTFKAFYLTLPRKTAHDAGNSLNVTKADIPTMLKEVFSSQDNTPIYNTSKHYSLSEVQKYNVTTEILPITLTSDRSLIPNGTLVDHESWENVVQSAPVIAHILNRTNIKVKVNETMQRPNKTLILQEKKLRKKRYMKSIYIEKSRPRNITIKSYAITEKELINYSNVHDLSRLVELQDDEMGGRVALRYLRNYTGSTLFNICNFDEPLSRQIILYNSSRIVITISNFTLHRLMVVLTPALTLLGNNSQCSVEDLECQIIGSRVCIDSLNACDGVPNCGSYDIYDEDRLLCGVAKGFQHNVYVAAFTFFALLLTLLYTIYYWLKRCVPKISKAFFIFSDTSENTLQLDTIMRSPKEVDDFVDKLDYAENLFDNVSIQDYKQKYKRSKYLTMFKTCCQYLLSRKHGRHVAEGLKEEGKSKNYSFTEIELRKYIPLNIKDECVQTGASIEIQKEKHKINNRDSDESDTRDFLEKLKAGSLIEDKDSTDELKLIKLCKRTKTQLDSLTPQVIGETEIRSAIYEQPTNSLSSNEIPVTCEIHQEKATRTKPPKRLRFDDSPTLIPTITIDESITQINVQDGDSINGDYFKKHLGTIDEEHSSKDFRRFWNKKYKKSKKIKHLSPR